MELTDVEVESLLERLAPLADTRQLQGLRHRQRSVLAVAVCAFISGARGSKAMTKWAARASQQLLGRLSCPYDPRTRRYIPPSETTLKRVLEMWPMEALEPVVGDWLKRVTVP
jgi:hypothetical protein